MSYDKGLAQRIRELISERSGVNEKKMFGGLAFMLNGNMCVGVIKQELMVRVGPQQYEQILAMPDTREMDFTGKPLKGFLFLSNNGTDEDEDLSRFIL